QQPEGMSMDQCALWAVKLLAIGLLGRESVGRAAKCFPEALYMAFPEAQQYSRNMWHKLIGTKKLSGDEKLRFFRGCVNLADWQGLDEQGLIDLAEELKTLEFSAFVEKVMELCQVSLDGEVFW